MLFLLIKIAVGTAIQSSQSAADVSGRVDIGNGRHIYLHSAGTVKPTVVLVAGLSNTGDIWRVQADDGKKRTMVFQGVASFTHVVAYDRPGTTLGADQFSRSYPVRPRQGLVGES